ncbi:unnamed protein product [Polarella glacialis]|uniref:rRNA-processing protein EFG1 n=1 Tax=Polarella glacialis TaxID=89957 RepID=A0A813HQT5_POLGL|nr:unnamed protein product [Polarella glacialis]
MAPGPLKAGAARKLARAQRRSAEEGAAGLAEEPSDVQAEGTGGADEWRRPRKWMRAEKAEDWRKKELERLNCTKYHYLKFVEKVKIERKLKSTGRFLKVALEAEKEEEAVSLREQLRSHLADHEYIVHYPKHLPYNALFPAQDSDASKKRREEIKKMIRETRAGEGSVDAEVSAAEDLWKGKSQNEAPAAKKQEPTASKKKRKAKSSEAPIEEPAASKKKKKAKSSEAAIEEPAVSKKKANSGEPTEVSLVGTKRKADAAGPSSKNEVHASWKAAKGPKVSGSIVKGEEGDRKVFDSDSEG